MSAGERQILRGELYWIAPDDSRGPAPAYSHPHVVVQDDVFNHSRVATVVVCALTTNLHRATEPGNVLLDPGEGGLLNYYRSKASRGGRICSAPQQPAGGS